jgi:hypothetical protein
VTVDVVFADPGGDPPTLILSDGSRVVVDRATARREAVRIVRRQQAVTP